MWLGEREGEIRGSLSEAGTYDQICFVVQQLETAVRFTDSLTESLVQCQSLLSSASVLVVQEVIHYLVVCKNVRRRSIASDTSLLRSVLCQGHRCGIQGYTDIGLQPGSQFERRTAHCFSAALSRRSVALSGRRDVHEREMRF